MEQLAEWQGDAELLIAIKSHRLNDTPDYLAIAQLCKGKGRGEASLQWALHRYQHSLARMLDRLLAKHSQRSGFRSAL
jgi:hypothetical protein